MVDLIVPSADRSWRILTSRTLRRGIGPFDPLQVTEMRGNAHFGRAGLEDLDTKDVVAEPCRGARGPAMGQALAKSLVTKFSRVAVNVGFAFWGQLIDAARAVEPIDIKVFPECGGATIQHPTPVGADRMKSSAVSISSALPSACRT